MPTKTWGSAIVVCVAVAACADPAVDDRAEPSPDEAALITALHDVLREVPSEAEDLPRYLADRFDAGNGGVLPPRIAESADLPLLSQEEIESRSEPMLVLNFATPRSPSPDSITVVAEWLVLESEREFWGVEFHYILNCSEACTFHRSGPGFLN